MMYHETAHLANQAQTPGLLDTYLEEHKNDPEFIAESLAMNLIEDAVQLMQQDGVSRSDLASSMNVSKAYITKLLNAPPNLTLLSVARLGVALEATPYISLVKTATLGAPVSDTSVGFTIPVSEVYCAEADYPSEYVFSSNVARISQSQTSQLVAASTS